jgi:hypothetical protein
MRQLAVVAALLAAGCGVLLGFDGDDDETITASPLDSGTSDDRDDAVIADGSGEATPSPADSGSDAEASVAPRRRVVFVTQRSVAGNFGGLAGGDIICAAEAADAGLGGQFVAWLANGNPSFQAKSRFATDAGWYLTNDGGEVFSGPSALNNANGPKVGINRTARGEILDGGQVWTGLYGDGVPIGKDCVGWTTTLDDGVPGNVGSTATTWSVAAPDYCNTEKRLYCFEK